MKWPNLEMQIVCSVHSDFNSARGVAISYHSISFKFFPKLEIAISFHFHCIFLPLLNPSKNKEWKEMAISKLHIKNIKKRKNLEAYLGTYGKTFGNIFHIF